MRKNIVIVNPVTDPSKKQIDEEVILLVPSGIAARLNVPTAPKADNEVLRLKELKDAVFALQTAIDNGNTALIKHFTALIEAITDIPEGFRAGDMLVFDGSQWVLKSIGTQNHVLTVDSTATDGTKVEWKQNQNLFNTYNT